MKKIQFVALISIVSAMLLSCEQKRLHTFDFTVEIYRSDFKVGNEMVFTSSGSYSPSTDDIKEIKVPIKEGFVYLGNKKFNGKIFKFPTTHSNSIEFIVNTEENDSELLIDAFKNFERENLVFSIFGNSYFNNLRIEDVWETEYSNVFRLCYHIVSKKKSEDFSFEGTKFIIDVCKD